MKAHGERVAKVREARAREGIPLVLGERATLPSSVVRRAIAIEALHPKRVVLFGDVDGLAQVLQGVSVKVVRPDAPPSREVVADGAVFGASGRALAAARAGAMEGAGDGSAAASPPAAVRRRLA